MTERPLGFLFSSPDGKAPSTARKIHIQRLYDILHLSIQRNDIHRAKRAFNILSRCKEIDWKDAWKTGLWLLAGEATAVSRGHPKQFDFLRIMMLQHPEERLAILQELILLLMLSGHDREALDELELYLPSFPYNDNPVLHTYAGLICLHLAQPQPGSNGKYTTGFIPTPTNNPLSLPDFNFGWEDFNSSLLRDAQGHFERARLLDPEASVAQAFLDKIPGLRTFSGSAPVDDDSDNDAIAVDVDQAGQRRKKARTHET